MKVLILTGKFGMGHVAAAEAVADRLRARDPGMQVEIIDLMECLYPRIYKDIYLSYNTMVNRMPRIYNSMICLDTQLSRLSWRDKMTSAEIVGRLVNRYEPDVIVSTWLFGSKYVGAYKKKSGSSIPFVTCVTDIVAFDEWIDETTDAYLVGSENTRNELVAKGVDPDIIHVGGIPVRSGFGEHCRAAVTTGKEVLIMGGGLGFIPCADDILDAVSVMPGVHATVITGRNKKLYGELKNRYAGIDVLGYTTDVPKYMGTADVIITKPGGITTFEAIQSELPLFIVNPYFEQEKANAAFIEAEGLGKVIWGRGQGCGGELESFLSDAGGRRRIQQNMRGLKEKMHAEEIGRIMDTLIAERGLQSARSEA